MKITMKINIANSNMLIKGWNWNIYNYIYGGLHRTCWAFSIAWIIYACQYNIAGPIKQILECSIFATLAPLCYSVSY